MGDKTSDGLTYTTSTTVADSPVVYTIVLTDVYGYESETKTVTVDKSVPVKPVLTYDNSATNQSVVVTANIPESEAYAVDKIYYSIDGTESSDTVKSGETITVSSNAKLDVWYFNDVGTKSEINSINISNIDTTVPAIEVKANEGTKTIESGKTSANSIKVIGNDTNIKEILYDNGSGFNAASLQDGEDEGKKEAVISVSKGTYKFKVTGGWLV